MPADNGDLDLGGGRLPLLPGEIRGNGAVTPARRGMHWGAESASREGPSAYSEHRGSLPAECGFTGQPAWLSSAEHPTEWVTDPGRAGKPLESNMIELKVTGMTCGGCVSSVKKAISRVATAAAVEVDLATGRVCVESPAFAAAPTLDRDAIEKAIAAAGFSVESP